MASIKVPVAIWTDSNNNWTASALDGVSVSATATDPKSAIEQVRKYLEWKFKKQSWPDDIDFLDPIVDEVAIDLRPRHQTDRGLFPSENTVNTRFRYVWGKRRDGGLICSLPTIDARFFCRKQSHLKALVRDQVIRAFAEATSSIVASSIFASEIATEHINVKVPTRSSAHIHQYPLDALPEVAIPLGDRVVRKQFSPAWNRIGQVEWLKNAMLDGASNILLVGPSGVGKTTVLVDAVRKAQSEIKKRADEDANNAIPPNTQRFWLTNGARLIAGMQYLGQWEQRIEMVIDELSEIQGVLCVESLLDLVQAGSREPSSSVASFLKHFMINRELRVIAETTPAELETIKRLLPDFIDQFKILNIDSMNAQMAIGVLESIGDHFRKMHQLEHDQPAVGLTYYLFKRFLPYDPFPGKCARFWRRLFEKRAEKRRPEISERELQEPISTDDVVKAFIANTGLPEFLVRDEHLLQADEVLQHFQDNIVGQPAACEAVTDMVMTFKAAMNDPNRPVGVYFFCGPTGVGKTEMAKALSKYLFGSGQNETTSTDERMIRVDMSEYAIPGSSERLLTKPDGRPSELVERVRRQPFVVLLLDEIEKAHYEVFDTLMNVFDEARLTDRLGRTTSFCSSVIVMTSNLGTSNSAPIGFDDDRPVGYEKEIRKFFRPEFFNRMDNVVTFNHLSEQSIQTIANKEIAAICKREGLGKRNIRIECAPEVLQMVSRKGYDRKLGARPLQRTIEQLVVTPIARWLSERPETENVTLILKLESEIVVCCAPE